MATTRQGTFITLEGVEGSGKTTQVERLADRLRYAGRTVVTTREPGGTPISDRIRAVVLDQRNNEIHPHTEALLMCAARAQLVHEVIRPALDAGQVVLCDRYSDSTFAYQGYARGQDLATLRAINQFATSGLVPHLTILLDLPAEVGLQRRFRAARNAEEPTNRMDLFDTAFHQQVAEGYHALAQADPDRWRLVDAQGSVDDVAAAVWETVAAFLDTS
ncbi:MAG: dTMP kinase [Chloroflexota bacterium]|nr:dTMP kinase [Chloroflexota bacterium]MDE2839144.1 dTMP kinase [Chloroflexota bacterium]MDE2929417.1 dTMP kinase [Chloroflexota bacterium]